jgi:hypothetical protein
MPTRSIPSPSSAPTPPSPAPAAVAAPWSSPNTPSRRSTPSRSAPANPSRSPTPGRWHGGEDPGAGHPRSSRKIPAEAVEAAAKADVAVVVVGRYPKLEGESFDVKTMDLPAGQDDLIQAVEKANPHTIVVLNTGDPVTMTKWLDRPPRCSTCGTAARKAATRSHPSSSATPTLRQTPRLLPKKFEDSPAAANYPGENLKVELRRRHLRRLPLLRHQKRRPRISPSASASATPRLNTAA